HDQPLASRDEFLRWIAEPFGTKPAGEGKQQAARDNHPDAFGRWALEVGSQRSFNVTHTHPSSSPRCSTVKAPNAARTPGSSSVMNPLRTSRPFALVSLRSRSADCSS